MTVLSVQDLSVTARIGGRDVAMLRRLSFTLPAGAVMGLVGESGAGKSMLGRAIAGLLPEGFRVSGGVLRFEGVDLLAQPPAAVRRLLGRRIAFIPQEPSAALDPVRSIGWQFGQHLRRLGLPRARALAALAEVGLRDPAGVLRRYAHQLSGGECQRVLIALAFVSAPALVVADEPTTALDVTTQATIVALLRQLQAAHGTAVLFITHDLRLAHAVCDSAMVLYAGDPVERGPARSVFATPSHPYTRALLAANPRLAGPRTWLDALPGTMPGPLDFADGCRFAPRCPVADPACAAQPPQWRDVAPGHEVACTPACKASPAAGRGLPPTPAGGAAPILTVAGLGKVYPAGWRRRATVALEPIGLQVAAGEIVGIVGESGSGKSTLARLLVGLERPSSGRMVLDGVDITAATAANDARRRQAVQMVFQNPQSALNPRRTVAEIVTQAMEVTPASRAARQARARELMQAIGLSAGLADRFPFQLSGGQRQRVNIARALCATPRILVADEIVSGLDVSVQAQLLNLLLRLRDETGVAILLISHDLSVVRYLCDRVIVLHAGRMVESAAAATLFQAPQSAYTRHLLQACPADP